MIQFKIAAKTNVGRVRENNEDNFQAADDLSAAQMRWVNDKVCTLGSRGALLVVADGMGGTNAGEVASEIAINTMREWFAPQRITDEVVKNRYSIERFMKDAVVEADAKIKLTAKENPASRNMGTTIVIGWLYDGFLYVTWCGDSRAYVYNPSYGLRQISKDHSYVQELVDQGKISQEDAFDFPDSNIITRCLSDSSAKARPDCLIMPYSVCNGDVILLCSDGLNGMLRDSEIEQIISMNTENTLACVDNLIQSACNAGGHDNITVALCQIISGGNVASVSTAPKGVVGKGGNIGGPSQPVIDSEPKNPKKWLVTLLIAFAVLLLVGTAAGLGYYYGKSDIPSPLVNTEDETQQEQNTEPLETNDSSTLESVEESNEEVKENTGTPVSNTRQQLESKKTDSAKPSGFEKLRDVVSNKEVDNDSPIDQETITPVRSGTSEDDNDESDETENPESDCQIVLVKVGQGSYSLQKQYNVSLDILKHYNPDVDFENLKEGQKIRIPNKK